MNKKLILSILLVLAAPLSAAERPNIVWIIAEDMNENDSDFL